MSKIGRTRPIKICDKCGRLTLLEIMVLGEKSVVGCKCNCDTCKVSIKGKERNNDD